MKPEALLAVKVSNYLQLQYPKVMFQYSIGADVRLPVHIAKRLHNLNGRWSRGFIDLFIYEAKNGYCGLGIELKATSPYKKDGTLKKNSHLERQDNFHQMLRDRGYKCEFAVGLDEVKVLIDEYLKEQNETINSKTRKLLSCIRKDR